MTLSCIPNTNPSVSGNINPLVSQATDAMELLLLLLLFLLNKLKSIFRSMGQFVKKVLPYN